MMTNISRSDRLQRNLLKYQAAFLEDDSDIVDIINKHDDGTSEDGIVGKKTTKIKESKEGLKKMNHSFSSEIL